MNSDAKFTLGVIISTLVLVAGGIFLAGKLGSNSGKADPKILIRDDSYKMASSSATVSLVEFSDFECPACGAYHPVVKKLLSDYKDKIAFVYRNFPLEQHKNAVPAAVAAEAAGKQGKYWEMFDIIFEKQNEWSTSTSPNDIFKSYASVLKLNPEQFDKDLGSEDIRKKIQRDYDDGVKVGIDSTPTFFVNYRKLENNPASTEDFKKVIDEAIAKNPITISPSQKYHAHANIKVYVDGKQIDFSQAKYQSKDGKEPDENVHFHDGNGDVVHLHKQGILLNQFLKSLGMNLTDTCFADDAGKKYCNEGDKSVKMFANGQKNTKYGDYEFQDLDRILITYGSENEAALKKQIDGVADTACIYSEKCPDRGKPPAEECVGGLGTSCK